MCKAVCVEAVSYKMKSEITDDRYQYTIQFLLQGMIALRRGATELAHEDYMDAILEVQSKKKANLNYYA